MKTTIKITNLTIVFIISGLLGFFNFFFTSKIDNFLTTLKDVEEFPSFSKIYIAIYVLAGILLLVSILSYLFNNFTDEKIKKNIQITLHIINCLIALAVIILYVIVKYNYYNIFDIKLLDYHPEEIKIEYLFYGDIFLILFLQAIGNIVLSALGLRYLNIENKNKEENTQETTSVASNNPVSAQAQAMMKEIEEMKATLELKKLKDEYLKLYEEVHLDDKNKK